LKFPVHLVCWVFLFLPAGMRFPSLQ
jgi:hypothetical protein